MAIDYASGPTVMMQLGTFQFGILTAAYQELTRSTEWRWPAQERFMQGQALQYVGPGGDTITLPGVIYPEYRGGFGQLNAMRTVADSGEPLLLIDGLGNIMGRWVIERIEEKQAVFAAAGRPRKQEFTLNLRKFDDDGVGTLSSAFLAATGAATAYTPDSVAGLAKTAAGTIGGIAGSISESISAIGAVAGELAGMAAQILAPAQAALRTANNLANSINDARRLLGMKPTKFSGLASANKMVNASTSATANAGQYGKTMGSVARDIKATGAASASAMKVVDDAVVNVNRLTVAAGSIQRESSAAVTDLNAA